MASKHIYTKMEKKVFLGVLKSHATIIENKNTDGSTLREKNVAWDNIAREYNASPHVTAEASIKQLRRLWMNLKQRQREAITKERQHRMATRGVPSTSRAAIDPDVVQIAPGLMIEIPGAIDSDTVFQESTDVSMDLESNQPELSLDITQQPCTSTNTQISQPNPSPLPYRTTTPPPPLIVTLPPPRIITTLPPLTITTPHPCSTTTPPPHSSSSTLPHPSTASTPPHPIRTIPLQPPSTSSTTTTSFQLHKNSILEKEYMDRFNRAGEIHAMEKELLKYKIREAKAKAELAELTLKQERSRKGIKMEPLSVDIVHFYPRENAQPHNTFKFESVNDEETKTAIVRRGQPFNGAVRFQRPFNEELDLVQLIFTLGDKPEMDTKGSIYLKRDVVSDKYSWSAKIVTVQDDTITFEISTPVNLPVGNWALQVVTRVRGSTLFEVFYHNADLYILFNPWNPDDQTYMEDKDLLEEYIQSDVGKVWIGPINTTRGKPWLYGQFADVVLPACMLMLNKANLPFNQCGNPVKVARAISRIVNFNDDDGVLVGRWDGMYEDGTAPADWTGSVDILQQFLETDQPVMYGQCWVFAGVVTTVCRALGIPSRVVSNLVSAHDTNSSLTVDKYYSETMEELNIDPNNADNTIVDSIWNYHVWNDVWMARPDLPPGYGGWQAIDATPQEQSEGMFQCGPAPLEAVKQGVIGVNYDVDFILSSVNADLMRWRVNPEAESGYSIVETNKYHIGRMILTKKPFVFDPLGDNDRMDIIGEYKHKEGTASERLAFMNGVRHSERAKRYYAMASKMSSDVSFKLRDIDVVQIGKDFRIVVEIDNSSDQPRHIQAALSATSVFYNGVKAEMIKKQEGKIFVGPGKHEEVSIVVRAEEYLPKLVEYCNMKISAMAIVDETKQAWADDDDFQVLKPNVIIKFNDDLIINEPATVELSFYNPLDTPLTEGEFRVTSPGIQGRTSVVTAPDVGPREMLSVQILVVPKKAGIIHIVTTYKSKQLRDINGAATVTVMEG